jgi:hypothetical protein
LVDNFREEVAVKRKRLFNNVAYFLSWVFMILVGFIGLLNLSALMAGQFTIPTIVSTLIAAGLCFLIWRNKDEFRTEYEYTFTNGDLDVAKVMANSRRKLMTILNMKNVDACGPVDHQSFNRYLSMKDVKKHNWFLNREAKLYYFFFTKNNVKHLIVVELSDEMIQMCRQYLNYGIWQGEK